MKLLKKLFKRKTYPNGKWIWYSYKQDGDKISVDYQATHKISRKDKRRIMQQIQLELSKTS